MKSIAIRLKKLITRLYATFIRTNKWVLGKPPHENFHI